MAEGSLLKFIIYLIDTTIGVIQQFEVQNSEMYLT